MPENEAYGPVGRSPWLDVDWRAHLRQTSVHGTRINYVDMGEGPPLLFVHGLSGCWQNWLEQLPVFARTHRALAIDLPGFGESELPAEDISISGYGRVVDGFCDAVGLDGPVALVGHSMGGFIGAELAIQFPQRVERLVLNAAAGISIEDARGAPLGTAGRVLGAGAAWITANLRMVATRPSLRRAALWLVVRHPDRLPAALCYEQLKGAGRPGFVPALVAMTRYPIRHRLTEIACPTLIVFGEDDRLVPVEDAHEFARLIPNSRAVIYEDTGHCPQFERPAAFNSLLAEFLAESPEHHVGDAAGAVT